MIFPYRFHDQNTVVDVASHCRSGWKDELLARKGHSFNKELVITRSAAEKVGARFIAQPSGTVMYSILKVLPLGGSRSTTLLIYFILPHCCWIPLLCIDSKQHTRGPTAQPPSPPTYFITTSSASPPASPPSRITFRIISQKPTLVPTRPALWF